ncbi:MAG TPA: AraC family transcriptional regulator, partial [Polyangiaceae bacterium]|nr:AraC family transcriptional regulator [Polyangiaceae bacterium]
MAAEIVTLAMRAAPRPGLHRTAIEGLQIIRADARYARVHSVHKPSLCFIVQGTKIVTVGDEQLRYGQNEFLYSSVELPITGEVIEATRRQPYLVLVLDVEPAQVFELVASAEGVEPRKAATGQRAIFVGRDEAMTAAFHRLLSCLA